MGAVAVAQTVPLPKPRPAAPDAAPAEAQKAKTLKQTRKRLQSDKSKADKSKTDKSQADEPAKDQPRLDIGPSLCALQLAPLAVFTPQPVLDGPGDCGAVDVVRLEAVTMPDGSTLRLDQPAMLRCSMAQALVHWVRDDVGPATAALGSPIAIAAYETYQCRGRNRVAGARLSEHGKANAIDIVGMRLADGRLLDWSNRSVARDYRERIRASACERFMTVLGPGSDGHHEDHIHVDLAERRSGYKLCRWEVRDTAPVALQPEERVPLPQPRPTP